MGAGSARFFDYLQGADFYWQLHREAVALLPEGAGRTWFDVGCGPGLVARLAQEHGYAAVGFDRDPHMIRLARRRSGSARGPRFVESGLDELTERHGRADVVSAASLLMVLPDKRAALGKLLEALAPGGTLLVVETSATMSPVQKGAPRAQPVAGRRAWLLRLWARARRGAATVDLEAICPPGFELQRHALLGGRVNAWTVRQAGILAGRPRPHAVGANF